MMNSLQPKYWLRFDMEVRSQINKHHVQHKNYIRPRLKHQIEQKSYYHTLDVNEFLGKPSNRGALRYGLLIHTIKLNFCIFFIHYPL